MNPISKKFDKHRTDRDLVLQQVGPVYFLNMKITAWEHVTLALTFPHTKQILKDHS